MMSVIENTRLAPDFQQDIFIRHFEEKNPELTTKYKIRRIKFALSKKQREELLDVATSHSNKHGLMIFTQLLTGMRVGELCQLRIQDINFTSKTIHIGVHEENEYCDSWDPKTAAGIRIITIDDKLASALRGYLRDDGRKRGYVFRSQKTKRNYSTISVINFINKYAKLCKSIKHTIGSHTLRRTYASYLVNDNAPIGDISKNLGHKTIKITMEYLFQIDDYERHERTREHLKEGYVDPRSFR